MKVKQHDIRDCGAACLASVAAYYKLHIPIARIRQLASTDQRGTNVLGVVQGAEKMGFIAKGVKGGMDALPNLPLPAIAHVVIGEQQYHHFVVIYKTPPQPFASTRSANHFVRFPKGREMRDVNSGSNSESVKSQHITGGKVVVMDPADGKMHEYSYEEFEKIWSGVLILLAPGEDFKASNQKTSVYRRFWELIRPHKSVMVQALFGAIVYTVLGLSTSIYIEKITDYVLVDGNTNLLNLMSVIMIVLLLLQIFVGTMKSVLVLKSGQLMDANLILGYYKHLLSLPQRFFDTMRVGEIISRVNDAVKIRQFINDVSINLLVNIFIVLFSFTLMFIYSWKLALIMVIVIPIYAGIYYITNKLNRKVERRLMENAAELEAQLVESLTAARTIKQFGIEQFANDKTENRFIKLLYTIYTSVQNSLFSTNSSDFLARLFTIVLFWVGAGFVIDKDITPGELFSFYALVGYFTGPVSELIGMNKTVQNAIIAADRLFEIMDLEREETTEKMELKPDMIDDITLQNIAFSYGTRADVFTDFSATFQKGKMTAVVGESGSGKTTLISLLQNLYPLKHGKITIGNWDLNQISNESLRKMVSVVPQQLDLFSGNVIDNIALGDTQPDMARVISLSQQLGITEFVEKMPNGFQTQLGENGALLSGGQRQRIAIARALYKNPEILILDEATSSLDSSSEEIVQKALTDFKQQGKTLIVIAHRLSTIKMADNIQVLEDGKLIEEGNHSELIKKEGKYYEMWGKQLAVSN